MSQEKALDRALTGTGAVTDFSGVWFNELKSKATIVQKKGVLSGTYESAVSSAGTSTVGDLRGYTDGMLISFVVRWRDFQAITAWVGHLDPLAKKPTIQTLWQMTKSVEQADEEWTSINAGADTFKRK